MAKAKGNSLVDKLREHTTIGLTDTLMESKLFSEKDMISTRIPVLNIALSGSLKGGLTPGLTMFAGPSKHFKTMFTLILAKAYMDQYKDAALLFYDSEFGTPISYFDALGIDKSRVVHTPITDVEKLKFDVMTQLEHIERGDKVFIAIDSIGNLASKKEIEDSLEQKSVADMTRAKQIKSLFRMVTPHLNLKNIPMVAVNHTYKTLEMFSKDVVGGGTGSYYSADNIFIIGRQQEKEKDELAGYNFIINVEKSRYVREKSKIPVQVMFEGGIAEWSGLFDIAVETKFITKISKGTYALVDKETGTVSEETFSEKQTSNKSFWVDLLANADFEKAINEHYKISSGNLMGEVNA